MPPLSHIFLNPNEGAPGPSPLGTGDGSQEPHHRPRRGHRNLAQGRGPQRQVFVAGVEDKFASANAVLGELQNML